MRTIRQWLRRKTINGVRPCTVFPATFLANPAKVHYRAATVLDSRHAAETVPLSSHPSIRADFVNYLALFDPQGYPIGWTGERYINGELYPADPFTRITALPVA